MFIVVGTYTIVPWMVWEMQREVEIYHIRSLHSDCDYQEKTQYKKAWKSTDGNTGRSESCGFLRIKVCSKKWINPIMLLWGWDWDHQTYSREGSGFLGDGFLCLFFPSDFFITSCGLRFVSKCVLSESYNVLQ